MGDFDFLGDHGGGQKRVVIYREKQSSGCLPVIQTALGIILAIFLMVGGCVALIGIGAKQMADEQRKSGATIMKQVGNEVANDAIRQYNTIVESNGSQVDLHVRAGLVAEAYLQSGNDEKYRKWKKIADTHAKNAGMIVP